ncbi:MAG: hypothetical protein AAFV45_10960 [Pseudomonadota bacterium]
MRNATLYLAILIATFVTAENSPVKAAQLCVGAKGKNFGTSWRCEYEAYVTTGWCTKRDGAHDPRYSITLNIAEPRTDSTNGVQHVTKNIDIPGQCNNACAWAKAKPIGNWKDELPEFESGIRCNVRSWQ